MAAAVECHDKGNFALAIVGALSGGCRPALTKSTGCLIIRVAGRQLLARCSFVLYLFLERLLLEAKRTSLVAAAGPLLPRLMRRTGALPTPARA